MRYNMHSCSVGLSKKMKIAKGINVTYICTYMRTNSKLACIMQVKCYIAVPVIVVQ